MELLFPLHAGKSEAMDYSGQRIDGYRGIWFELGHRYEYGDRYSGGLGTYTAYHQPAAVHAPKFNKTFFTYGGTPTADQRHLLIMVSFFDHATGEVPRPVVVCDKLGVDDPHDNGAIQMDDKGYIWIFVSGRNRSRPGLVFRSMEPGSIWGFRKLSEQETTYPQPWWIPGKGFLFLFTKYTDGEKGQARELYWKTSPDGLAWSEDSKLAGFEGHYQVSGCHGEKVATFFNWHPESENNERTNLYYVETTDFGKSWGTVDGQKLELPLCEKSNPALVIDYHSLGRKVYTCDLNFDAQGRPILLYVCSRDGNPGPQGDPREWKVTHWTGVAWESSTVAVSTHNYDMGSLQVHGDVWRVMGPTDAGPQVLGTGGEVVLWESRNRGKSWERVHTVTRSSKTNHSHVRRPLEARDPFYAFWADGDAGKMSESHLYFSDSTGENVFQLPYDMGSDTARPKRVLHEGDPVP